MLTANSIKNAKYLRVAKEMLESVQIHKPENSKEEHSTILFHVHNAEGQCTGLTGMCMGLNSEEFSYIVKFSLSTFILAAPSCNYDLKKIREIISLNIENTLKNEDEESLNAWLISSQTVELFEDPPQSVLEKYPVKLERLQYFKSMIFEMYIDKIFDMLVTTADSGSTISNYLDALKRHLKED